MDTVQVNEQGQVTLSPNIMEKMGLKRGGELFFCLKEGEYILKPTPTNPMDEIRKLLEGEAENLCLKSEDDVVKFSKQVRQERKKYANNA